MSPESYRHYSVVAVHGWDICRVVLGLPRRDSRRVCGEESTKVGHGRREAEAEKNAVGRLLIGGGGCQSAAWVGVAWLLEDCRGGAALLIPGLRNVAWKNPRRNRRLLLLRRTSSKFLIKYCLFHYSVLKWFKCWRTRVLSVFTLFNSVKLLNILVSVNIFFKTMSDRNINIWEFILNEETFQTNVSPPSPRWII